MAIKKWEIHNQNKISLEKGKKIKSCSVYHKIKNLLWNNYSELNDQNLWMSGLRVKNMCGV